jgi:hypothetical protein
MGSRHGTCLVSIGCQPGYGIYVKKGTRFLTRQSKERTGFMSPYHGSNIIWSNGMSTAHDQQHRPMFKRIWGRRTADDVSIRGNCILIHQRDQTIAVSSREINNFITALREAKRNIK